MLQCQRQIMHRRTSNRDKMNVHHTTKILICRTQNATIGPPATGGNADKADQAD
jgi:hypothetical protein